MRHRGFEPRTTWLKVKCSTNWANIPYFSFECPVPESNQRHEDFQSSALPTELTRHIVAGIGFEPMTSGLWARRASRLLHPAIIYFIICNYWKSNSNGQRWIRTTEAICSRFTVCPLWPLGNLPISIRMRSTLTIWNYSIIFILWQVFFLLLFIQCQSINTIHLSVI